MCSVNFLNVIKTSELLSNIFTYLAFLLTCAFVLKQHHEESDPVEESNPGDALEASKLVPKEGSGPVALPITRAR